MLRKKIILNSLLIDVVLKKQALSITGKAATEQLIFLEIVYL